MFKKKYKEYKTPWYGYLLFEVTHKEGFFRRKPNPQYYTDKVKNDYNNVWPGIEIKEKESKFFDFNELINPTYNNVNTYLKKKKYIITKLIQ